MNTIENSRPLFGARVMVTRPAREKGVRSIAMQTPVGGGGPSVPSPFFDPLIEQLRKLGAEVVVQPAIRISAPPDWRPVDDALVRLHEYDWVVFSSVNGVRYLFDRLAEKGNDRQSPIRQNSLRLAAIGPGTAEELRRYGLRVDLVPEQFRAESLAEALEHEAKGRRFLLARASRGREVLANRLTAAGAVVEQIIVYTSTDVDYPDPEIVTLLHGGCVDWTTVTSSAIARSLVTLFGDELRRSKLASLSPITSDVLRKLGHEPSAEAAEYTLAGLAAAIVEHRRMETR